VEATQEFGKVLKRLRLEAGLSQESLAERARISAQAVSALERGARRAPYRDTLDLLAAALDLTPEARAELESAANRRRGPKRPRSAEPAGETLRTPLTSLVGRYAEMERLEELLRRPGVRLLTLTGPGGIGKTRLALAVAEAAGTSAFERAPLLVSLAAIRDPQLLGSAIASSAGVRSEPSRSTLDVLARHFGEQSSLLVLDNFEQIVDAAPLVLDLLQACPKLKVLVTSRAPLRLRGEVEFAVVSLHSDEDAVTLFADRARAANPSFEATPANTAQLAEICRRLDRLPLALELAAPQLRLWSPEGLLARMERRLDVLVGGAQDLPERHQTMRRTIEWSYGLLDAREQSLLRRLSVFAAGFDLDMAESVSGAAAASGERAPFEVVAALHDHGLLQRAETGGDAPRLVMLETIREFALERLMESGEYAAASRAHADCMQALTTRALEALNGPHSSRWMRHLDEELDNIRAALQWARAANDGERGLSIAAALERYWERRGLIDEGRGWLEAFIAPAATAHALQATRAYRYGLMGAAILALRQNDFTAAVDRSKRTLELAAEAGDELNLARANSILGMVEAHRGDPHAALTFYERALPQWRASGNVAQLAAAANNHAVALFELGRLDDAAAMFEECIALSRSNGNAHILASALSNRSSIGMLRGDPPAEYEPLLLESLELLRAGDDRFVMAAVLGVLGEAAERRGDFAQAAEYHRESLRVNARSIKSGEMSAHALLGLARVAHGTGRHERALLLLSAAARERERLGVPGSTADQQDEARLRAELSGVVEPAAAVRAEREAALRAFEDIVAEEMAGTS
jgi:predicted ATPase/DNA-binding XRE family transcriptional regulator